MPNSDDIFLEEIKRSGLMGNSDFTKPDTGDMFIAPQKSDSWIPSWDTVKNSAWQAAKNVATGAGIGTISKLLSPVIPPHIQAAIAAGMYGVNTGQKLLSEGSEGPTSQGISQGALRAFALMNPALMPEMLKQQLKETVSQHPVELATDLALPIAAIERKAVYPLLRNKVTTAASRWFGQPASEQIGRNILGKEAKLEPILRNMQQEDYPILMGQADNSGAIINLTRTRPDAQASLRQQRQIGRNAAQGQIDALDSRINLGDDPSQVASKLSDAATANYNESMKELARQRQGIINRAGLQIKPKTDIFGRPITAPISITRTLSAIDALDAKSSTIQPLTSSEIEPIQGLLDYAKLNSFRRNPNISFTEALDLKERLQDTLKRLGNSDSTRKQYGNLIQAINSDIEAGLPSGGQGGLQRQWTNYNQRAHETLTKFDVPAAQNLVKSNAFQNLNRQTGGYTAGLSNSEDVRQLAGITGNAKLTNAALMHKILNSGMTEEGGFDFNRLQANINSADSMLGTKLPASEKSALRKRVTEFARRAEVQNRMEFSQKQNQALQIDEETGTIKAGGALALGTKMGLIGNALKGASFIINKANTMKILTDKDAAWAAIRLADTPIGSADYAGRMANFTRMLGRLNIMGQVGNRLITFGSNGEAIPVQGPAQETGNSVNEWDPLKP